LNIYIDKKNFIYIYKKRNSIYILLYSEVPEHHLRARRGQPYTNPPKVTKKIHSGVVVRGRRRKASNTEEDGRHVSAHPKRKKPLPTSTSLVQGGTSLIRNSTPLRTTIGP